MANAVTFWKGPASAFTGKTIVDGRIYFVNDDDNLGALYLGVASGETTKAVMISPRRLTELALGTTDATSTVTAKAVVDFVKANFDSKGAYDSAIEAIEGRLDAVEGILAGLGGEEQPATVVAAIATAKSEAIADADGKLALKADASSVYTKGEADGLLALKANAADVYTKEEVGNMLSAALEFKGVVDTVEELEAIEEKSTGDVYFVTADNSEYVYVGDTGKWEKLGPVVDYTQFAQASVVTELAGTVADNKSAADGAIEDLQKQIDAITGGGEEGDSVTLAGIALRMAEAEGAIDDLEANKADKDTYEAKVAEIEGRLDATEGVANGAAAAVATKVEQEAFDTYKGEIEEEFNGVAEELADRYTKTEVEGLISAAEEGIKETTDGLAERLTATEGVANGAAAAVATKVAQDTYDSDKAATDAILAGIGGEEQPATVVAAISAAISAAALVWLED